MSTIRDYECRFCGKRTDRGAPKCPSCRRSGGLVRFGYKANIVELETLEEVIVPELIDYEPVEGKRISVNSEGANRVLGASRANPENAGLHIPSFYLLGGGPGTGKTTFLLYLASLIDLTKLPRGGLLFHSSEQHAEEIHANARDLGLLDRLRKMRTLYTQDINELMDKVVRLDPIILFTDSVNKLTDPRNPSKDRNASKVALVKILNDDAFANDRGIIAISHLNKDGDYTGFLELQHDVQACIMMTRAGGNVRMLQCPEKNRYGDIEAKAFFKMGKKTFEETQDPAGPKADEVETVVHDAAQMVLGAFQPSWVCMSCNVENPGRFSKCTACSMKKTLPSDMPL